MTETDQPAARSRRSTRARPTDEELLDAALGVFAEHGFAATTMSAVAVGCDSTKPTLYAHFGDKDALFTRLLDREAARCKVALFDAYEASSRLGLREQVAADVEAFFGYAAEHPDGFSLLLGGDVTVAAVRVREQLMAEINDHLAHRVHAYLADRGEGSPDRGPSHVERQLAAMLVGVCLGAAQHALAVGTSRRDACDLAVLFSVAALSNLDPTR